MRVLVVTVVHHPLDARIHRRQIGALLAEGHHVTYGAPWSSLGVPVPTDLEARDLPRAVGRRRIGAIRAARTLIRQEAPHHDVVLLHDPELLAAVARARTATTVWDVHEDGAATIEDRPWVPTLLAPVARWGIRRAERWASRHLHLIVAETSYRERLGLQHPVVPNVPVVPNAVSAPGRERVVAVGRISTGRGWHQLRQLAGLLADEGVRLELFGSADADIEAEVQAAAAADEVVWHGFVPNEQALARISGALAGLSLLHDLPNYRHSMPTKVAEYLAVGVPAVTTPLPLAAELVARSGGGVVVPFRAPDVAAAAILELRAEDAVRGRIGAAGHAWAQAHLNWAVEGPRFVDHLQGWATADR